MIIPARSHILSPQAQHHCFRVTLMSDIFLVCMLAVKGCQTLVMDPTSLLQQSLVNAVPHCKMLQVVFTLVRERISDSADKNLATFLTTHIIDV